MRAENKRLRAAAKAPPKGDPKGKGGGKGDRKGKGGKKGEWSPPMPAALRHCAFRVGERRLCLDYNLEHGCSRKVDQSNACPRGVHVCARKDVKGVACGANHPQHYGACPNR